MRGLMRGMGGGGGKTIHGWLAVPQKELTAGRRSSTPGSIAGAMQAAQVCCQGSVRASVGAEVNYPRARMDRNPCACCDASKRAQPTAAADVPTAHS